MVIYDSSYNKLISEYISPLADYRMPYSRLRQHHIKSLLHEKIKSIEPSEGSNFAFHFNRDDLIKAQVGDINLFYLRMLLQGDSVDKVNTHFPKISADWTMVTDYYYAFFLANVLLRICHRGVLFFDAQYKKTLNEIIDCFCKSSGCTVNNYSYRILIDERNSEYTLCLSPTSHSTHEIVWEKVAEIILEMADNAESDSDEHMVLSSLVRINRRQGSTFPSQLRNKINYQPHYGVQTIDRKFFLPNYRSDKWLATILSFDNKKTEDLQSQINLFSAYIKYLQILTFNLIHEYETISKQGSGLLSALNKTREQNDLISVPGPKYTYP